MQGLNKLRQEALVEINNAENIPALDDAKNKILGKKGTLTALLKDIKNIDSESRAEFGSRINNLKSELMICYNSKKAEIEENIILSRLMDDKLDVSLLSNDCRNIGSIHPVNQFANKVISFFSKLGYHIYVGPKDSPEIEISENNFDKLNFAKDHPAKSEHDTLYLNIPKLLRTHTSSVQIHKLKDLANPTSFISYGKVYRSDTPDATHTPMFHQLECVCIDYKTNFSQLKAILQKFLNYIFEENVDIRFRISYFPFTEPSAEVDIRLKSKENAPWIEVLGCGMIHPNVLKNCNVQESMRGYAFGIGIERLLMLKFGNNGMTSLRPLYENDLRFLEQFRGRV